MNEIVQKYGSGLLMSLLVGFGGCFNGGCSGMNAFPRELSNVAGIVGNMVADQGLMEEFTGNIRGHVNEPGLQSYVSLTVAAGVKMTGVDGDIGLEAQGVGTQLPKDVREALIQTMMGPVSDADRAAIMQLLAPQAKGVVETP